MKYEEAKKLINWEEVEEITQEEWQEMREDGEGKIWCEDKDLFFKQKQKFPIVFENNGREVVLSEDGEIHLINKKTKNYVIFYNDSIPLLEKAIDKIRELRKND